MLATRQNEEWTESLALAATLQLTLAVAHAEIGVLMLHDEECDELYPAAWEGLSAEACAGFGRHHPGIGPFGTSFAEHRRIVITDAMHADCEELRTVARRTGFQSIQIAPLALDDGHVLGTMSVCSVRSRTGNGRTGTLIDLSARALACTVHGVLQCHAAARARGRSDDEPSKLEFLARLSHELRTPLQSIGGYLDLLRTGVAGRLEPAQMDMLDRAAASKELLLKVVEDLITFSRIRVGRVKYQMQAVLAADVLAAVEMVATSIARSRGVTLTVERPALDLAVHADPGKLEQVLVNLVTNGLKFTPTDGAVTVRCERDDTLIAFTVADTGPGIPEEKLEQIFEPFVRLDGHDARGSGLGLAISRELADGMGGTLSVSSKEGKGATFTLCVHAAVESDAHA